MKLTFPCGRAAPEPKSETWLKGGHIDPSNPKEVKRIISLMDQWAKVKILDYVKISPLENHLK